LTRLTGIVDTFPEKVDAGSDGRVISERPVCNSSSY